MAPEGSKERAAARSVLLRSLTMALQEGMSVDEWKALANGHMPETVAAVSARDMRAIVRFALGNRRPKHFSKQPLSDRYCRRTLAPPTGRWRLTDE